MGFGGGREGVVTPLLPPPPLPKLATSLGFGFAPSLLTLSRVRFCFFLLCFFFFFFFFLGLSLWKVGREGGGFTSSPKPKLIGGILISPLAPFA